MHVCVYDCMSVWLCDNVNMCLSVDVSHCVSLNVSLWVWLCLCMSMCCVYRHVAVSMWLCLWMYVSLYVCECVCICISEKITLADLSLLWKKILLYKISGLLVKSVLLADCSNQTQGQKQNKEPWYFRWSSLACPLGYSIPTHTLTAALWPTVVFCLLITITDIGNKGEFQDQSHSQCHLQKNKRLIQIEM